MMDRVRPGQRLLLALTQSSEETDEDADVFHFSGIIVAVGGVLSLIFLVLMCTCKKSPPKDEAGETAHQEVSKKVDKKSPVQSGQDVVEIKPAGPAEVTGVVNGGPTPVSVSSTLPGHSRQASSSSAHNMRPTSLRELPEPPVSSHHTRNTSLSGLELPSASGKGGAGSGDYNYPQHLPARNTVGGKGALVAVGGIAGEKVQSHSDGYDHLGPKPSIRPKDYDSLDPESTDGETPVSETGGVTDGHYSQLRERTYAVVNDVKAQAKEMFDPYWTLKDKDDASSDDYSQMKEEDPYNHIGDSDGAISASFIRRLKQSTDVDDPYATVQEDSGGESIRDGKGSHQFGLPSPSHQTPHNRTPSSEEEYAEGGDEYAVVHKARSMVEAVTQRERQAERTEDFAAYNYRPPEPPRLYNTYEEEETEEFASTTPKHKREHKYSKVTARESLASMSARNALNPYEFVPDLPENTYATVEGGSGDGVVMRNSTALTGEQQENRLSQNSDTYAEIGISGGGLTTSMTSTSSSTTGGNNSGTNSGAPVPPSLDSLHLMTKSQTSSEGDRLSDRHLASPEDSGLGFNQWGDNLNDQDSGESSEDGYSTLKKTDYSPHNPIYPHIPGTSRVTDEESGEVTLVPNYQTVKDCISDNENADETENDPNYESVDETRAKVAALKMRASSGANEESRHVTDNWQGGAGNHVTVVKVLHHNSSSNSQGETSASKEEPRRRRPFHDYEEVDISPPLSPSTPVSSSHHAPTSPTDYHSDLISYSSTITTSTSTITTSSSQQMQETSSMSLSEARERVIESHMYEELTEVQAKKLEMTKSKKTVTTDRGSQEEKKKSSSGEKKKNEDKRKSGNDEKKQSGSDEKRKSGGDEKRKSGSEDKKKGSSDEKKKASAEEKEKKKSNSDEKKKSSSDDKKKSSSEDKKKSSSSDEKKKGGSSTVMNGTRL